MKFARIVSVILPQSRFERHSYAWIAFIFANAGLYSMGQEKGRMIEYLADYILSLPIIMMLTYLTVYLLVPRLLFRDRPLYFAFSFLLFLILAGILEHIKTQLILLPLINPENSQNFSLNLYSLSRGTFFILIPVIYFITIKYARDWYNMKVLKTEEESKHLRNELKYLKAQVHPHFLMVTLSNLESLAKEEPEKAAPGIEKISEILNFILYECNFPSIRLNKEIEQIHRFIELQELNFKIKPEINYSIIGPTIEVGIAPLMLFTIVEFFFKKTGDVPGKIMKMNIFLEIFHNLLNFTVESEQSWISEEIFNEDAGIINLKKRISILYKNKGEISFRGFENKIMVRLHLAYT